MEVVDQGRRERAEKPRENYDSVERRNPKMPAAEEELERREAGGAVVAALEDGRQWMAVVGTWDGWVVEWDSVDLPTAMDTAVKEERWVDWVGCRREKAL